MNKKKTGGKMMTFLKTIRSRFKMFSRRRNQPVIRIERLTPWKGEKLVGVLVHSSNRRILGLFALALLLAACSGQSVVPNTGGEGPVLPVTTDDAALKAIDAAVNQLSQSLGVNAEDVRALSAERVEWGTPVSTWRKRARPVPR
jgi:hypothetical protein